MNNEEAKQVYSDALQQMESRNFAEALRLFDILEAEKPNSRSVMYRRAVCLIRLNRLEEAQKAVGALEGKIDAEQMTELRVMLKNAAPAPPPPAAPNGTEQNVFLIESAYATSPTETTVTGQVVSGAIRLGDTLSIATADGGTLSAPILRIGTAETPLNLVRAGQKVVIVLNVDPTGVTPGLRATSSAKEEHFAATMMVAAAPKDDTPANVSPELVEVERLIKRRDFDAAQPKLERFLAAEPNSVLGHRLMARIYLESDTMKDPPKALLCIRRAYELGGAEDPAVIDTLALAFAATGEAEQGLRFLERLFTANISVEAKMALTKRIQEFREQHHLGHVWEFSDEYGEIIFTAERSEDIVKALRNGTIQKNGMCRRDHIGEWRPLEAALAPDYPDVAAALQGGGGKGGGGNQIFIVVAAILVIAIIAVLFFIMK